MEWSRSQNYACAHYTQTVEMSRYYYFFLFITIIIMYTYRGFF